MSINARTLAGAAVLVMAVAGCQSAAGPATPSASLTPSAPPPPTASSTSSSSASATAARAVFPSWYTAESNGAGILPAGNGTSKSFNPGVTFTVPEGWVNGSDEHGVYGLFPDTPANQAEFAASGGLAHEIFMGPHESPYFVCDAWEDNRGATAAEMVAKIVANDALAVSDPVDVLIGGLAGKQIDVRLDTSWKETCPGDSPTVDLMDMRTRGILLDRPGGGVMVIFVGSPHSAGHDAFVEEATPIIESFDFG
jgi:hypothetical protein